MADGEDETGRYRQRRRTRAAIVAATMDLLRAGGTPSVAEIAEAADVSRRTVYLHFPTLEQLLVDATIGMLSEWSVDEALDAAAAADDDVDGRVETMIEALGTRLNETLPLGRSLIRLTVDPPESDDDDGPRRGYRRIAWIEQVVEPLRGQLGPDRFEHLVSALAMVIGWEAFVVLADVRGLPTDEQLELSRWSARALIRAAVDEAAAADPARPPTRRR